MNEASSVTSRDARRSADENCTNCSKREGKTFDEFESHDLIEIELDGIA